MKINLLLLALILLLGVINLYLIITAEKKRPGDEPWAEPTPIPELLNRK